MRVAALMPTRDRTATAHRAAGTFLSAVSQLPGLAALTLVVADDSSDPEESDLLRSMAASLGGRHGGATIIVAPPVVETGRTVASPGRGPGAPRNRALTILRESCPAADVTIILDDDVSFEDVEFRGERLRCDGAGLIRDAIELCRRGRTIAGCAYSGRQDLSILEHARLSRGPASHAVGIDPSLRREDVESVAPGGISTAFLVIPAPPSALPAFPEHYNEDYVWLHSFERAGWSLARVDGKLIHAPPGDVAVTAAGLSFQIHGEIVWLAVLERDRYPVDDPRAIAAAVDEIAGDLRAALTDAAVSGNAEISDAVSRVLRHYETLRGQIPSGAAGSEAERLIRDIRRGLALTPPG